MNIGERWNPEDWDDEPLNEEELEEVLDIHKRHVNDEKVCVRSGSERVVGRCN